MSAHQERERPRRAEHDSLEGYLRSHLSLQQLSHVALVSFSEWEVPTGAIAETAVALHLMGGQVSVALWSDDTPLKDVGWTTLRSISRLLGSPSTQARVREALLQFGLPKQAFPRPPIRRWTPVEELVLPPTLNRTSIRSMRYRGGDLGRAILQVPPDSDTPMSDDYLWPRGWIEATACSYAYVYDQVSALISQRGATAVAVYNGRFLHDSAAAAAAEAAGVPILAYDMGGNDTDFDLTVDATHDWSSLQRRMLRLYETWPRSERDELGSSWFVERTRHSDPRNTPFVETQVPGTGIQRPNANCLVVYFSSSGDEISELDLEWSEYFHDQATALNELAKQCDMRPGYQLVVRSHPHKRMKPKRDVADWLEAVDAAAPDIHIDPFSPVDSYELMRQADVVVTYGSTTGVEAAYAGKPSIVMGPSAYDELGCASRVRTAEELGRTLDDPKPGWWPGAVAYGLMMRRRGFVYQHIQVDDSGVRSLAGVEITEASPLVLKVSHLLGRVQRWRLTR